MGARLLSLITSISFLAVFSACGVAGNSAWESNPPPPVKKDLKVGDNFLTTSENWIDVGPIVLQKSHFEDLYYHSDLNGKLILSIGSFGLGSNCDKASDSRKGDFSLSYTYFLKDQNTGAFTVKIYPDDKSIQPSVYLKSGQDLMIHIEVQGLVNCTSGQVMIMAIFQQ